MAVIKLQSADKIGSCFLPIMLSLLLSTLLLLPLRILDRSLICPSDGGPLSCPRYYNTTQHAPTPKPTDAAESPPPLTAPKRHQSWARVTLSPSLLRASVSISWVPLPPSLSPCLRPKKERVRGPILFRDGGCGLPSSSFPPRSPFGTTIAVEPSLPSFDGRKRGCGRRRRGFADLQKAKYSARKHVPTYD